MKDVIYSFLIDSYLDNKILSLDGQNRDFNKIKIKQFTIFLN